VEGLSAACMAATKRKRKILLLSDTQDPIKRIAIKGVYRSLSEAIQKQQYEILIMKAKK
jgi:hypothetical protein